jgi:hypothetical protein
MKKIFISGLLIWFALTSFAAIKRPLIENASYEISIPNDFSKNPRFVVTQKTTNLSREVRPEVRVAFSGTDPKIKPVTVDNYDGVIAWGTQQGDVKDIFKMEGENLTAKSYIQVGNTFVFSFPKGKYAQVTLEVELPQTGSESPSFIMEMNPEKEGYFSLGFIGIGETNPEKLDFLYQPLVWSWKRFPTESCQTEEAFCTTAATFVNTNNFTEGIAPAPEMIPYRYALATNWNNKNGNKIGEGFAYSNRKGNSLFGLSVRNTNGKAQPTLFAPLLGGEGSKMEPGQKFSFTCKYLLAPGDWMAGTDFLLRDIANYKNERQNGTCSLNETLENMIDLGMNDRLSGWKEEYKAFDYRFDAPGTVKMVSALHALGIALVTGDDEIYKRRALPLIEYEMSHKKFLFSIDTLQHMQFPSHEIEGPACEVGELSGLYLLTGKSTPAFEKESQRIFGKARQLNLQTVSVGASWQNYMAKYLISDDKEDLDKAEKGATDYIGTMLKTYSDHFVSSLDPTDSVPFFQIEFTTNIYDLFELYEITGKQIYLDAAHKGARQLLLWCRSNPMAPDSLIKVNEGDTVSGVFYGRREGINSSEFVPGDYTSHVAQTKIPAWRTSLVGTFPETPNTYIWGPIMLANHAAWFMRIAALTGDKLLADAGYNAIIGRYANFPGYYFTSLFTNVYQLQDYPTKDYYDIKYNAIFYNHLWPHIALLNDFLISDAYYRSGRQIDFPSVYAPGYAFLASKVYGAKPGKIYGNENIRLWLPLKSMKSCNTAINHLFGIANDGLYLILMNTSNTVQSSDIELNQDKVSFDSNKHYLTSIYSAEGKISKGIDMINGKISVSIPSQSLVVVKMEGLIVKDLFGNRYKEGEANNSDKSFLRIETGNKNLGTITGMMLNHTKSSTDAYIYSTVNESVTRKATLKYKIANGVWQEKTDAIYPFEFSIPIKNTEQQLTFIWVSESVDGIKSESVKIVLNN